MGSSYMCSVAVFYIIAAMSQNIVPKMVVINYLENKN